MKPSSVRSSNSTPKRPESTVDTRYGGTGELAATILEEGEDTPASLFFSQDAGALGLLADEGRFATLPAELLDRVEERFRDPEGRWVGVTGRARVLAYNTDTVCRRRPARLGAGPHRSRLGRSRRMGTGECVVPSVHHGVSLDRRRRRGQKLARGDDRQWNRQLWRQQHRHRAGHRQRRDRRRSGEPLLRLCGRSRGRRGLSRCQPLLCGRRPWVADQRGRHRVDRRRRTTQTRHWRLPTISCQTKRRSTSRPRRSSTRSSRELPRRRDWSR